MPSRPCREKPLRLSGFRECLNTTSVSVRKRVHRPRINFARDRDSRIETGGRMNTPRERPKYWGMASTKYYCQFSDSHVCFKYVIFPPEERAALHLLYVLYAC